MVITKLPKPTSGTSQLSLISACIVNEMLDYHNLKPNLQHQNNNIEDSLINEEDV